MLSRCLTQILEAGSDRTADDRKSFSGDDLERVVCSPSVSCELLLVPRWTLTLPVFPLFDNGANGMHNCVSYLAK